VPRRLLQALHHTVTVVVAKGAERLAAVEAAAKAIVLMVQHAAAERVAAGVLAAVDGAAGDGVLAAGDGVLAAVGGAAGQAAEGGAPKLVEERA
jgi:hypothetical protein